MEIIRSKKRYFAVVAQGRSILFLAHYYFFFFFLEWRRFSFGFTKDFLRN